MRTAHEVDFFTFSRLYPSLLFPGNTDADPSGEICHEPATRCLDSLNPLTWRRTGKAIVEARPDVLLLQWWTSFWFGLNHSLCHHARNAGIPVITLAHQFVEPDASRVEVFFSRSALRRSDGLLLLSEKEMGMARRFKPEIPMRLGSLPGLHEPSEPIPDRSTARAQLGIDDDRPVLLFFGFVRRYKGLHILLEALASVAGVHLVVAGEFWENEEPYRSRISELGIDDKITLLNRYQPNEELSRLFIAADVLVLPYVSCNQSAVATTALDHGLPVIASKVGGLAETIEDGTTGLLVPPGDSARLAEAVERFFAEDLGPVFRRAIASRGRRPSWAQLVSEIESLAAEVVQERSPGAAMPVELAP
jgi:glycosyltransferase involved in cell wall biosynthesis